MAPWRAGVAAVIVSYGEAERIGARGIGAKADTIARLSRFGYAVPDGFAIDTSAADDAYAAAAPLIAQVARLSAMDLATPAALGLLAAVRTAIESAGTDDLAAMVERALAARGLATVAMAVRSSATGEDGDTRSFAGMHDSVLDVRGAVAVSAAIRRCQASVFTDRAVSYRRLAGVADGAVRPGVLVCRMVQPTLPGGILWSGVAFTIDPASGDRDRFVIEMVAGVGTALVSGIATPLRAVYDLRARHLTRCPDWPEAMAGKPLDELIMLLTRLHWTLGRGKVPQDIEWTFDGARIVILQCRPVTSHPDRRFTALASDQRVWSDANLREVFPDRLSPFSWSLLGYGTRWSVFDPHRAAGFAVPSGMELVRRQFGRTYLDIHALQWAAFDAFGVQPEEFTRDFGGHHPDLKLPSAARHDRRTTLARSIRGLRLLVTTSWRTRAVAKTFARLRSESAATAATADVITIPDAKRLWGGTERQMLDTPFLVASGAGPLWMAVAERVHAATSRTTDPRADLAPLLTSAMSTIAGAVPALLDLAASGTSSWQARWSTFVRNHGHRGFAEMDLATERWREQEPFLREYVGSLRPTGTLAPRASSIALRRSRLVMLLLDRAITGYGLREDAKSTLVALLGNFRIVALAVGRHLVREGHLGTANDIFALSAADVKAVVDGAWTGEGAAALVAYSNACETDETLPEADRPSWFVDGLCPTPEAETATGQRGAILRGTGVSAGKAIGVARVLASPKDAALLGSGEILVAAATDPGWTPLFAKAAAVVTEHGGFLSHAAIVARELGVPAVANIAGARQRIRSGMRLSVDGNSGTVIILARSQRPDR